MFQFQIQTDSEIPPSKQLFDLLQFAIANGQYSPGHRLPSIRQLAAITGLHRNTISKVYRQLEKVGLVESSAGSGIYVKAQGHQSHSEDTNYKKLVKNSVDELISLGCSLNQVKDLFLLEIDWRLRCMAQVLLTVPTRDIEAGTLMLKEIQESIPIPIQLVPLEELSEIFKESHCSTVITSRYFIAEVMKITSSTSVRVLTVDIYDYAKELKIIKELPTDSRLGIVSLSAGTLKVAEIIVHSLRGNDLLIMTAQCHNTKQLHSLIRACHTIISDSASYNLVKQELLQLEDEIIRYPRIIRTENYIGEKSINLLKRELGLGV